jgi:hypothetical protein
MNYTERMQELEREHEKIGRAITEAQAQALRIEGAILLLRELIEEQEKATTLENAPAEG